MTRNEVIRTMQKAYDKTMVGAWGKEFWTMTQEELERFAALVAAAERKACLALVNKGTGKATSSDVLKVLRMERKRISTAIRARK